MFAKDNNYKNRFHHLLYKVLLFVLFIFLVSGFSQVGVQEYLNKMKSEFDGSSNAGSFSSKSTNYGMSSTLLSENNDRDYQVGETHTNQNYVDMPIDDNSYQLNIGDELVVYIWGRIQKVETFVVNKEGNIIIPTIGVFEVSGKYLSEVKQLLKTKLEKQYKNLTIEIELKNIWRFRVYISGEVLKPGSYLVHGMMRVSDLIEIAGGINKEGGFTGATRGIIIKNNKLKTNIADFDAFKNSTVIDHNPYLRIGDNVFVPIRKEVISVYGSVAYPGIYDFIKGDKAKDLLIAAGGYGRGVDSSSITITRFVNNMDSLKYININNNQLDTFTILPDDRMFIRAIPDYRKHRMVEVTGEVNNPGMYPIRKGKTKLLEIISMAGGFTEDAFLKRSKLIRSEYVDVGEKEFERLKLVSQIALSPIEKSFLKSKYIEEKGIVTIDFSKLVEKKEVNDLILSNNDKIIIAKKTLTVKVSGAVVSPGLVSYKKDMNYDYYIEQAGGYTIRARKRKITLIKADTEVWLRPKKMESIEAGDAIWVPEDVYIDRFEIMRDIIIITGSIATTLISIFTIQDKLIN